jgi:hypothetical protein
MSTTARTNKQADKFREMAGRLQKEIGLGRHKTWRSVLEN